MDKLDNIPCIQKILPEYRKRPNLVPKQEDLKEFGPINYEIHELSQEDVKLLITFFNCMYEHCMDHLLFEDKSNRILYNLQSKCYYFYNKVFNLPFNLVTSRKEIKFKIGD